MNNKITDVFWLQKPLSSNDFFSHGNKYFKWLEVHDYHPKTVSERKRHIMHFVKWCHQENIYVTQDVSRKALEVYQRFLFQQKSKNNEPFSPSYRMQRLTAISMFFRWIAANNLILFNPAVSIEIPKISKKIPRNILTHEEVKTVLNNVKTHTSKGFRVRTILETLYSTAMRSHEITQVQIADINFEYGTIHVHGKGKKDRIIPIGNHALKWIYTYIDEYRILQTNDPNEKTLFLNQHHKPYSSTSISHLVTKYIQRSGIDKKGSCHLIRHSVATLMLENGADIRQVQQFLGHATIKTTQIYTHISIGKLKEVHTRTHPAKTYKTKTILED